jgi:malate dehydrogenase (oxaloacetate-decarboxylating)(NADP+)
MTKKQDALDYHARGRPGKIAVVPTKPLTNQRDLSLAYSPGVAEPCLEIKNDADLAYTYTAKGNLVAVVTNGTAVLGLGNIGALAGKPVMEGKGNLFKQFADIDVFDIEVGSENPDDVIKFCQLLEPTVGGINLEDIRAPDCFYIEETLRKTMRIPVFHDDQHGTAIISGAALLNALSGRDESAHDRRRARGRRRVRRPLGRRRRERRDDRENGVAADRVRARQSGTGNPPGRGARRSRRRDRRHGP